MGGCRVDGESLFSVVVSTGSSGHKLEHWRFHLNIRKQLLANIKWYMTENYYFFPWKWLFLLFFQTRRGMYFPVIVLHSKLPVVYICICMCIYTYTYVYLYIQIHIFIYTKTKRYTQQLFTTCWSMSSHVYAYKKRVYIHIYIIIITVISLFLFCPSK